MSQNATVNAHPWNNYGLPVSRVVSDETSFARSIERHGVSVCYDKSHSQYACRVNGVTLAAYRRGLAEKPRAKANLIPFIQQYDAWIKAETAFWAGIPDVCEQSIAEMACKSTRFWIVWGIGTRNHKGVA